MSISDQHSTTSKALSALHKKGVHFVLCRAKDEGTKKAKSAIASGWQLRGAALKPALESVKKPHVSQASGENEWYTPPKIIEAAR